MYSKFTDFPKITEINRVTHKNFNFETDEPFLYIKDPIGKIYYSEEDFFRENIAVSAFAYAKVKALFRETYEKIQKVPKFENFLNFGNF